MLNITQRELFLYCLCTRVIFYNTCVHVYTKRALQDDFVQNASNVLIHERQCRRDHRRGN